MMTTPRGYTLTTHVVYALKMIIFLCFFLALLLLVAHQFFVVAAGIYRHGPQAAVSSTAIASCAIVGVGPSFVVDEANFFVEQSQSRLDFMRSRPSIMMQICLICVTGALALFDPDAGSFMLVAVVGTNAFLFGLLLIARCVAQLVQPPRQVAPLTHFSPVLSERAVSRVLDTPDKPPRHTLLVA